MSIMRRNQGCPCLWPVCLQGGRRLKGEGTVWVCGVSEVIFRGVGPEIYLV